MNDILDVLLIRILFLIIITCLIILYRFCHVLLYPTSALRLQGQFFPSQNPAETIFLFSRVLGIALIFSQFNIFLNSGFLLASFDFILTSLITFSLYLLSIFILESIVLSDFDYSEEITRKNNICYALVSSSFSIGISFIFQTFLNQSITGFSHNLLVIVLMWSITIVTVGFSVKTFPLISKLDFSQLLPKKSLALGISYFGFFLSWMIIISSAFNLNIKEIKAFASGVILKIILSLLIFPLFKKILIIVFKFNEDIEKDLTENQDGMPSLGYGIYEGVVNLTSALMTSLVTSKVFFPVS